MGLQLPSLPPPPPCASLRGKGKGAGDFGGKVLRTVSSCLVPPVSNCLPPKEAREDYHGKVFPAMIV